MQPHTSHTPASESSARAGSEAERELLADLNGQRGVTLSYNTERTLGDNCLLRVHPSGKLWAVAGSN